MSNRLKGTFVDQLPIQKGGTGRRAPENEVNLASQLRENRGKWARLDSMDSDGDPVPFTTRNQASNLANGIKSGKRMAWTGGGYEATVRQIVPDSGEANEFQVFVRYFPDGDQPEFSQESE